MLQIAPRGPCHPLMLELHALFVQAGACTARGRMAGADEWHFQAKDTNHDVNGMGEKKPSDCRRQVF